MRNVITDLQTFDGKKIHLTIAIKSISSKDAEEERVMHSSTSSVKFTPYSDANDAIEKLFKSLRSRYQEHLETSVKESDFNFDLA